MEVGQGIRYGSVVQGVDGEGEMVDESTTAACSSAARADGGRMRRSLVKWTSSMIQEMYVSAVGDGVNMDGRTDGRTDGRKDILCMIHGSES